MVAVADILRHAIRPLANALRSIAGRAKVMRVEPAKAGRIQRVQVLGRAGAARGKVDHFEPYGLAAHPLPGAEAAMIANAGDDTDQYAYVIGDPRHHPLDLQPGEVVVYSAHGQILHLKQGGHTDILAPGDITLRGANVTIEAEQDLRLRGDRVLRYAETEDREDVAGYARGLRHDGGADWTFRNWTDGALPATETYAIEPPEVDD